MDAMASVLKGPTDDDDARVSSGGRQVRKSTVPAMFSAKNPRMSVRQNSGKTIADDETEEVQGHVIKKKLKKRKR